MASMPTQVVADIAISCMENVSMYVLPVQALPVYAQARSKCAGSIFIIYFDLIRFVYHFLNCLGARTSHQNLATVCLVL
uniref:Uncharacterized protein n=1 Tax=Anguilla anguilla TaxID=7936 RepID=A0A0E9S3T2_ANGAN